MSLDTIKNVWLRPATPNKMTTKRKDNRTRLGRIIQGEKGIGRFAIHKLGTKIELYTRTEGQEEVKLLMNFRTMILINPIYSISRVNTNFFRMSLMIGT